MKTLMNSELMRTHIQNAQYSYQQDQILFPLKANYLLIDDDPVFQLIMGHQAELDNMSLECIENFDKRRDLALLKASDLIILDYELAGTDAPRLLEEFKVLAIQVPILVISHSPRNAEHLTISKNVKAFLPKSKGYIAILHAAEKILREKVIPFFH